MENIVFMNLLRHHRTLYPFAEFGAGHIVLSDCNFDVRSIDFCLAEIQKYRDGKGGDLQAAYDDPEDTFGHDHDATEKFLEYLKVLQKDVKNAI